MQWVDWDYIDCESLSGSYYVAGQEMIEMVGSSFAFSSFDVFRVFVSVIGNFVYIVSYVQFPFVQQVVVSFGEIKDDVGYVFEN